LESWKLEKGALTPKSFANIVCLKQNISFFKINYQTEECGLIGSVRIFSQYKEELDIDCL